MRCAFSARGIAGAMRTSGCMWNPSRWNSTAAPSEADAREALRVLGLNASCTMAEIKKKYVDLAKTHHPDVSQSSTDGTSGRMVDINNAYQTISKFFKSGKQLHSAGHRAGSSDANRTGRRPYYQEADPKYQPWHEDINPLFYEMLWEEMRRQNEEDVFASTPEDFFYGQGYESPQGWRTPSRGDRRHGKPRKPGGNYGDPNKGSEKKTEPQKSTTWPDADVSAMVNMYQDGKSFEFIANALGKEAKQVLEEFNRWSDDKRSNRKKPKKRFNPQQQQQQRNVYQRGNAYCDEYGPDGMPHNFYHGMEDDDEFDDDEFGYYNAVDDNWDNTGGGYDPYGSGIPFTGTHYMSGGPVPFRNAPRNNRHHANKKKRPQGNRSAKTNNNSNGNHNRSQR